MRRVRPPAAAAGRAAGAACSLPAPLSARGAGAPGSSPVRASPAAPALCLRSHTGDLDCLSFKEGPNPETGGARPGVPVWPAAWRCLARKRRSLPRSAGHPPTLSVRLTPAPSHPRADEDSNFWGYQASSRCCGGRVLGFWRAAAPATPADSPAAPPPLASLLPPQHCAEQSTPTASPRSSAPSRTDHPPPTLPPRYITTLPPQHCTEQFTH